MASAHATPSNDVTALAPQASIAHKRIGIALIVLSCVLYFVLIAVPLMPLDTERQVLFATGLAVSSEGTFWLGCLIAGRSILAYLGNMIWPARWRSRATAVSDTAGAKPDTSSAPT